VTVHPAQQMTPAVGALRATLAKQDGVTRARAVSDLFAALPAGWTFVARGTTWTKDASGWWDGVHVAARLMKGGPDRGRVRKETSHQTAHSWAFGVELWLNPAERDELWQAVEKASAELGGQT